MGTGLNPNMLSQTSNMPHDHMIGSETRDEKMVPERGGQRIKEGTD